MKYAPDDPQFAAFVNALDPVNASAEQHPGFVWRLVSDDNVEPELVELESRGWLVNMSVWERLEDLKAFIRTPLHFSIMRRRTEWFQHTEVSMCLWWVPAGHIPTFAEAMERLNLLEEQGPSERSFHFADPFPPGA